MSETSPGRSVAAGDREAGEAGGEVKEMRR